MAEAITIFDLNGVSRKIWVDNEGRLVTNAMLTEMKGTISETNSTTDLLEAGETFTGEWEEIKDYAIIKVGVYSDQAAASGGLCFQQSPDQNIVFDEPYDLGAGDKKLFTPNPILKYFRIVYTNGGTLQGEFSIQTIYSSVYTKPTSHRLGDTVTGNDDTELTKTVIAYRNEVDDIYKNVGVQNPFPVDGDSVYEKDIWEAQSDIGDFSGEIADLFNNLHSTITDTTSNNPKEILIHFNRTVVNNVIGLGAFSGNFSNTLIQIGNSGGVFTTVIDESSSSTKYTSRTFQLPITAGFNAVKIQFHTADQVSLSNCVILKTKGVVARLQAAKPDNTITDINATTGGNLKISLEELESGISDNSNSQLKVTPYESTGGEYKQDVFTGSFTTVSYDHYEIHSGSHFFNKDWVDLGNGATYDILVVTPDTTKWTHLIFNIGTEAETNITWYKDTITSNDGTLLPVINRNGNSATVNGTLLYHTPTITNVGTPFALYKSGSGKLSGGTSRANNEAIFEQNTKYLLRITNATTSNNWVDWIIDWYEHTNR